MFITSEDHSSDLLSSAFGSELRRRGARLLDAGASGASSSSSLASVLMATSAFTSSDAGRLASRPAVGRRAFLSSGAGAALPGFSIVHSPVSRKSGQGCAVDQSALTAVLAVDQNGGGHGGRDLYAPQGSDQNIGSVVSMY